MNYPQLAKVDETVNLLTQQIMSSPQKRLWQLQGHATTGKTTTLRRLSHQLAEAGFCSVYVNAPPRALDSGAIALVRVAGALKDAGLINGKIDHISDPKYLLEDKISVVGGALRQNSKKVILLLDEPQEWAPYYHEEAHFAVRTQRVIRSLINENNCRCVVAGKLPDKLPAARLSLDDSYEDLRPWLLNSDNWGPLYSFAKRVGEYLGTAISKFSPLDLRLLVALSAVTSSFEETVEWAAQRESRRDISRRLAHQLVTSPKYRALAQSWAKIAMVRGPFPPSFLKHLAPTRLDEITEGILTNCLIFHYKDEDKFVMHELLRQDARSGYLLSSDERSKTHGTLSYLYREKFTSTVDKHTVAEALADEMETYHHAVESGNEKLVNELRVFFVDQLNHFGKVLSRLRRFKAAADVFQRAVTWDADDDYANHYLAYNLDIDATAPQLIETHYRKAIDLEPENVWWWSRWINYLITRGRIQDARVAWGNALDVLGFQGYDDSFIYEHLHIWVARLLIHRGELDFASEVLRDIDKPDAGYIGFNAIKATGIKAMQRRLVALLEARENRSVFPLSIPHEKWWQGPHKSPLKSAEGELVKWLPGRIEGISEDSVFIKVAERAEDHTVTYYDLELSTEFFDLHTRDESSSDIAAGRFLEISYYGSVNNTPEIYVHRDKLEDKDIPPLFPNPQRFILRRWPRR